MNDLLQQHEEKLNCKRYGSTGTLSTDYLQSSSLEPDESTTTIQLLAEKQSLNVIIDSNDDCSSKESALVPARHSRDSSTCSDLSASDEDGHYSYYDLYYRHLRESRRRGQCNFIDKHIITRNNFKVVVSAGLWFICYMIMGILGGSVAYMHFQRSDSRTTDPLPDYAYDVIPYYCPRIPYVPHGNVQTVILFFLYTVILVGVIYRWSPRYHPKSRTVAWGGDGRLILQHICHLNCLVFLTRTSTVGLTGLPQPNPKCVHQQHYHVTFSEARSFVIGRGFPPHACGDLIYSGHVGCTLICMAVMHRHGYLRNRAVAALVWLIAVIGIYFTISCRSHYSVDVVLAIYFGYGLPEWYFNRSDGRVRGPIGRWIRKIEVLPSDLELRNHECDQEIKEEQEVGFEQYPPSINV